MQQSLLSITTMKLNPNSCPLIITVNYRRSISSQRSKDEVDLLRMDFNAHCPNEMFILQFVYQYNSIYSG